MPAKTLSPNRYIALGYNAAKEGTRVAFELESDIPVKTYIVRRGGLTLFKEGSKTFRYYGGFPEPRKHQFQNLWLPFSGPWYLIVSNPNRDKSAQLTYEVTF